jgi:hypothetical protein
MAARSMSGRMARSGRDKRPGSLRRAVVLALGVAVVVAVVVAAITRPSAPAGSRITAFQSAIHEPIQHWGKVEVLGMRPAMDDLRRGAGVPPPAIAREARAWQGGLALVGRQLAAVAVPNGLSRAMTLFTRALAEYVHAAVLVEQAASTDGADRASLLDAAVQTAQHGDCLYDDASVEIQRARGDAGLAPTIDFPNHPCPGAGTAP